MTKTVFDNHGVAHAWASRSQDEGRSANGNFYFVGDTIYSYGSHFPVAMFYGELVLINDDSYSVSTSRHQSLARGAVSHMERLYLPYFRAVTDLIRMRKETRAPHAYPIINKISGDIESLETKLKRARAEWRISQIRGEIRSLEHAAHFIWTTLCGRKSDPFAGSDKAAKQKLLETHKRKAQRALESIEKALGGEFQDIFEDYKKNAADFPDNVAAREVYQLQSRVSWTMRAYSDDVTLNDSILKTMTRSGGKKWVENYKAKFAELQTLCLPLCDLHAELDKRVAAIIEKEQAEQIEKWLTGEGYAPRGVSMMLRVKDGELQTNRGASVPLPEAIKLTQAAALCRKRGKGWKRNGEKKPVGMFQTDRITERGDLIVGCHNIPWHAIVKCVTRFEPEIRDIDTGLVGQVLNADTATVAHA